MTGHESVALTVELERYAAERYVRFRITEPPGVHYVCYTFRVYMELHHRDVGEWINIMHVTEDMPAEVVREKALRAVDDLWRGIAESIINKLAKIGPKEPEIVGVN